MLYCEQVTLPAVLLPPQVKNPGAPESARVLALLSLGEVGRNGSLGGSKEVQGVILEAFSSPSEEVRRCMTVTLAEASGSGSAACSIKQEMRFSSS